MCDTAVPRRVNRVDAWACLSGSLLLEQLYARYCLCRLWAANIPRTRITADVRKLWRASLGPVSAVTDAIGG